MEYSQSPYCFRISAMPSAPTFWAFAKLGGKEKIAKEHPNNVVIKIKCILENMHLNSNKTSKSLRSGPSPNWAEKKKMAKEHPTNAVTKIKCILEKNAFNFKQDVKEPSFWAFAKLGRKRKNC